MYTIDNSGTLAHHNTHLAYSPTHAVTFSAFTHYPNYLHPSYIISLLARRLPIFHPLYASLQLFLSPTVHGISYHDHYYQSN